MNAAETLRVVRDSGIRVAVDGPDLVLDVTREPDPLLLAAIRANKPEIMELLGRREPAWSQDDWQAFFDERAGIAEYDGGQTRDKAEETAYQCCIAEWLNRDPRPSDPEICAWCETPDSDGHVIVPFGAEGYGHTWLHHQCWSSWQNNRRQEAQRALASLGIRNPVCGAGRQGPQGSPEKGRAKS